jgi:hypothetical protein
VEFLLVPMPRLEIETIQDFKILHEIGALTPDMTVKLSRILLGEEPGAARKSSSAQPGKVQGLLENKKKQRVSTVTQAMPAMVATV